MAIERVRGHKTLSCDECGDVLDRAFRDGEFIALVSYAKGESWSVKPDGGGGWTHKCADCRTGSGSKLSAQRKLLGR